ncbi:probable sodium/metabolite cotransporter BASS2, chloroplastic isoform X1 [Selaginella moellendorffii]|uniref:probable sodium/metabolite cotransporter BASS2, chloroplastic isoform X1 n=1 Tax=Selaginella moellendorffii TaxID=88036 RepID=UPI000D1CEB13|nr:probable sodium/metabolite cotransporter BASS2, chloroplastic isoform X1 [Selaginella moellendorffii]|eukprot:XP_024544154.1 probable sodium/metabolite cotransporter BASS2, chloroplastic isoform X1 [Selaginella moellendorffii]
MALCAWCPTACLRLAVHLDSPASFLPIAARHHRPALADCRTRGAPIRSRDRECRAQASAGEDVSSAAPSSSRLEEILGVATSLYPVYVVFGGLLALARPQAYSWFVSRSPGSYSFALGAIMLSMGFTLKLSDLADVLRRRPAAIAFGFMAQYVIMPVMGAATSRFLNLSPMLSAGLILMSCCPGGTASNVVTYIARGDVPLSIIMTACTTIGAVFATPLLTLSFAGAYIPVDIKGLALSTLQVVLAPVLLGAWLQGSFPHGVAFIKPFAPLAAVLISSLLASRFVPLDFFFRLSKPSYCSVFSVNVGLLSFNDADSSSLLLVATGVVMVHTAGFLLGYVASKVAGFEEPQSRAISIEVGMQNSSLGVVLANSHFASPLACVPPAVSAVLMNIMGSALAVAWRHFGDKPEDSPR